MLPEISLVCGENANLQNMLGTGSAVLTKQALKNIYNWTNLLRAVSVKECKTPAFSS